MIVHPYLTRAVARKINTRYFEYIVVMILYVLYVLYVSYMFLYGLYMCWLFHMRVGMCYQRFDLLSIFVLLIWALACMGRSHNMGKSPYGPVPSAMAGVLLSKCVS